MFGHESLPSRIYSYGANAPIEGKDALEEQFLLANRFRNVLVELEHERRKRRDAALASVAPGLASLEVRVDELSAWIEEYYSRIRVVRGRARKRVSDPATETVAALKEERKSLYASLKEAKVHAYATEEWKALEQALGAWLKSEKRRINTSEEFASLAWGTRGVTSQAITSTEKKGPPPRFRAYRGEGRLAVQVQRGKDDSPFLTANAFSDDTRIQATRRPGGVWVAGSQRTDLGLVRNGQHKGLPRWGADRDHGRGVQAREGKKIGDAVLKFRIGSNDERQPIWASVPFTIHRPMPADAQVKWVYLIRRRVGSHFEWRVQFVLSRLSWEKPRATGGAVGVDVGWRIMPDDRRLRVACWEADDGARGEVCLSPGWIEEQRRCERIKSARGLAFDVARTTLVAWLKDGGSLPEPLHEKSKTLASWRSPGRLAGLSLAWRRDLEAETPARGAGALVKCLGCDGTGRVRHRGNEVVECSTCRGRKATNMATSLEGWRRRDRHLWDYETNLRDQLAGSRRELYRRFGHMLRERFARVAIEDLDLRKFHRNPLPDEPDKPGALKFHARNAALSFLLDALEQNGAERVPAAWTTRDCADCGHENEWDDQSPLVLVCAGCGATWDQDQNGAKNLLKSVASGPAVAARA